MSFGLEALICGADHRDLRGMRRRELKQDIRELEARLFPLRPIRTGLPMTTWRLLSEPWNAEAKA